MRFPHLARLLAMLLIGPIATGAAANLQTLARHLPASAARLQPIGQLDRSRSLNFSIALPLRNQGELADLLKRLYDPASVDFRKFLTPAQFAERFGPAEQDYAALVTFIKANGLKVRAEHPNRTLLDIRGTVPDIEKAFHVTMRIYRHPVDARTFYAPDADPTLDAPVPILSVCGLDDYTLPSPKNLRVIPAETGQSVAPNGGSGPGGTYLGNDFRAAYAPGVNLTGVGQAVGLVEFDGYYQADITNYEGKSVYTNVLLTNILVDDATGIPDGNALKVAEVSADIEMAIAMAPGLSQVMVYEVSPTSTYPDDLLDQMATDDVAKQLSSSWSFGTDPGTEQTFLQFAAQGQSFFSASGDVGAYTGGVPNPEDDPYITIVGGTTLTTTNNGAWASETTWNQGGGTASSGGISQTYSIPYWQAPINMSANGGSTTMRNIPDAALTADNVFVIYNNGTATPFAGTSCAAPLWAGFMALANQQAAINHQPPAGFINPALYWIGQSTNYETCFHDIATGNNTNAGSHNLFDAVPGYDLCTGWGTPSGSSLIAALSSPEPLQAEPSGGFQFEGLLGGPFGPSHELTLTNIGGQPLAWKLANIPAWLTVQPTNGILLPDSATNIALAVNTMANSLSVGTYTNGLLIIDGTDGFALYCPLTLQVQQTLLQNGGFETGNLSGWTVSGASGPYGGASVLATRAYHCVHSGAWGAELLAAGSLGYLSQTAPTTAGQAYLLSLWLDSPDGATPNAFVVEWNGNTLFDEVNIGAVGWTNLQFAVLGTSPGTLTFGFRDDAGYLGLDEVSLVPVPIPNFQSVNRGDDGTISLAWSAGAGLQYQLQYTTNLAQPQWLNLGSPFISGNENPMVSTPIGSDEARFYRVLLAP